MRLQVFLYLSSMIQVDIKRIANYFIKLLPFLLAGGLFFILPWLYSIKMKGGIIKADIYLIWIIGLICWIPAITFSFRKSDLVLGIGILIVSLTSLVIVKNDTDSIKTLITLFFSVGIYFFLSNKPKYIPGTFFALLPAFIFQVIQGWSQVLIFGTDSLMIKGSYHNSGYFANWITPCILIFFAIACMPARIHVAFRIVLWMLLIPSLVLLFLTVARAALVGFFAGIVFIVYKRYTRGIPAHKRKGFWVGTALIFVCLFVILFRFKQNSALGRVTIYRVTKDMIIEHPLLGVGADRFKVSYNLYQANYFETHTVPVNTQLLAGNTFEAFNFILQLLAEYGVLGLLLSCAFFYYYSRENFEKKTIAVHDSWRLGCAGAIISIFCEGMFSNPFHSSPVFVLFIVLLAAMRKNQSSWGSKSFYTGTPLRIFNFFIVASAMLFCVYGVLQFRAELKWSKAASYARFGEFELAKPLYADAYDDLKNDGGFLYNYGAESADAFNADLSISLLERATRYNSFNNLYIYLGVGYFSKGAYQEAERSFLKALAIMPASLYAKYQLIRLYIKWGHRKEAQKWLNYTLSYPVKVHDEFSDFIMAELASMKIE